LPNAKTQFLDANGNPLVGGKVYTYVPNTTTPKTTWQDAFEVTPNADPVVLDSAGSAFIFGAGNYTETLNDANDNLIWSGYTSAPLTGQNILTDICTTSSAFPLYNATTGAWVCSTVGGTGSLATLNGGPLTINPTAATTNQGLVVNQTFPNAGSQGSSQINANQIVTSDGVNLGSGAFTTALFIEQNLQSNILGQKAAIYVVSLRNTAATSTTGDQISAVLFSQTSVSNGGTNTGAGASGTIYGSNPIVSALAGATDYYNMTGEEVDRQIFSGASTKYSFGLSVANAQVGFGAVLDAAIEIGSSNITGSFGNGVLFTAWRGAGALSTTGCAICTDGVSETVATGIDLSPWTITGNFLKGPGSKFSVNGAGTLLALNGNNFLYGSSTNAGATLYNILFDTAGNDAIVLGGGGATPDHENDYENTTHVFGSIALGSTYVTMTTGATGIKFNQYGSGIIHSSGAGVLSSSAISLTADVTGTLPIANGGTNCASASITCFNNITGFTAAGTTGTTSTNLVFSDSPTLVTPTLGVATGTSLALGGATVGGNALAVTGTTLHSGVVTVSVAGSTQMAVKSSGSNNSYITIDTGAPAEQAGFELAENGTGYWQFIKQASSQQFLIYDVVNAVTAQAVIPGAASAGGITFGYTTASTSKTTGSVVVSGGLGVAGAIFSNTLNVITMAQTSAAQSGTVCYNSGTGLLTYDATLGCLASLEELKDIHGPIIGALAEVEQMKPIWFSPINRPAGSDLAEQPGFGAHQIEAVDKRLVGYDEKGNLRGVRYMEMTAVLAAAIKELKADNDNLRAELRKSHQLP
jgi:hypothetical protein